MNARRRGTHAVAAIVAGTALALAAMTGCTPAPGGAGPRFVVSADPSPGWEPVGLRLLALPPGERVTIRATISTAGSWSSQAVYAVPPDGEVDLARQAPLEAPFSHADGMGLFWSMQSPAGAEATSDDSWAGESAAVTLTATVEGRPVASTVVHRVGLSAAAPSRPVLEAGITGDYFEPVTSSGALRPAVIVFDDTDPGTSTGVLTAATLSAMGVPALDLSTYGGTGQLAAGTAFPAARFLAALDWLRSQPGVDHQRIFALGTSRGAQLALWAAVSYPGLVYGAIAPGGTTGLVCQAPVPSPVVIVGGNRVPCTSATRLISVPDVFDLAGVRGPVVLGCAGDDEQLPNGCEWMAVAERTRTPRPGDASLRAPGATHLFFVPPYSPLYLPPPPHAEPTERAREALWADIRTALAVVPGIPAR